MQNVPMRFLMPIAAVAALSFRMYVCCQLHTCSLRSCVGAGVGKRQECLLQQHAVLRIQRDRLVGRHPEQLRLQSSSHGVSYMECLP